MQCCTSWRCTLSRPLPSPANGAMNLAQELEAELQQLRLRRSSLADSPQSLQNHFEQLGSGDEESCFDKSPIAVCQEQRLEYTNGDSYQGSTLGGLRHGQGTHSCSNGDTYTGQWYKDHRHGIGTANFARGAEYSGTWVDDCANGEGLAVYENGSRYNGAFSKDKRCGWGKQNFCDGSWYEGEWDQDCMHGQGRFAAADASYFQGEWKAGTRIEGIWHGADGSEYDGEWKGTFRHGRGTFVQPGFAYYAGEWADDELRGQGRAQYADGTSYEGQWHAGVRQGWGKLSGPELQHEGEWQQGLQHGQGICQWEGGERYSGDWQKGKRHGRGKCVTACGDKYEGEWQGDKQHGHGTCAYKCGDRYTGQWERGRRHGEGLCLFADGMRFQGMWADDAWVQSTADPTLSRVHGPGMARAVAGSPTHFLIQARDDLRNERLCGGDTFVVRLAGPKAVQAEVADNEDGTYTASYNVNIAGQYQLHIESGLGEPVAESPYALRVVPDAPCIRRCTVAGPGCRAAVCGVEAHFHVEARDQYDNRCLGDALAKLPISIMLAGSDKEVAQVQSSPCQEGRYRCTYTPASAGFFRLEIASGGLAIRGSPFSVQVSTGAGQAAGQQLRQLQERVPDLGQQWWQVAAAAFSLDNDLSGWDSDDGQPPETSEQRYIREHPEVPVVDCMEDLWKVGKLQRERKGRQAMLELQQEQEAAAG